jgi:hypothetical protein
MARWGELPDLERECFCKLAPRTVGRLALPFRSDTVDTVLLVPV